jgi:outer membrane protein assembly factor BamB
LVDAAAAIDDARLLAAARADGDWMTFGRDYSNQRFAPFGAIDRTNVSRLAPVWVYELGTVGSVQTHPLVVGGVMYVGMAGNDVAAVNAATGAEIWRYRHRPRTALPQVPSNRGVAVAYGRVFEATDDARVIALDQATGAVVWDHVVPPFDPAALLPKGQKAPEVQFNFRAAPLVYDGKVIVGATGFEANRFDDDFVKTSIAAGTDVGTAWINANLGRRGFLSAFDAQTGAEVWMPLSRQPSVIEGSTLVDVRRNIALRIRDPQLIRDMAESRWKAPSRTSSGADFAYPSFLFRAAGRLSEVLFRNYT